MRSGELHLLRCVHLLLGDILSRMRQGELLYVCLEAITGSR